MNLPNSTKDLLKLSQKMEKERLLSNSFYEPRITQTIADY